MIKPSEFCDTTTTATTARLDHIEVEVDKYIARGVLRIPVMRDGWTSLEIEAVAERYRAVGWTVSTGVPDHHMVLARPGEEVLPPGHKTYPR